MMWIYTLLIVLIIFGYKWYYRIPNNVLILSNSKKDGVAILAFKYLFQTQIQGNVESSVVDFFGVLEKYDDVHIILDVVDYEFTSFQVIAHTFQMHEGYIYVHIPYKTSECGLVIALCGNSIRTSESSYLIVHKNTILNLPLPLLEQMKLFSSTLPNSGPREKFTKEILQSSDICTRPNDLYELLKELRSTDAVIPFEDIKKYVELQHSIPSNITTISRRHLR